MSAKIPRKTFGKSAFRGQNGPESRAIRGEESWYTAPTRAGMVITPDTSATIAVAYAAIIVLASDLGAMPFNVMRRDRAGAKRVDWDHPVQDLVFSGPNDELTAQTWLECSMWHLLTRGNAYTRITTDSLAMPDRLDMLDPDKVRPERTSAGELFYRVEGEPVPARMMLHVRAPGYNGVEGKSPIRQCKESFGLTSAVEGFGQAFFGNGIVPKGAISFDEEPDEETIKELRRNVDAMHRGVDNAFKLLILTNGGKWTPTSIPPEEAQFLLTRRFQLEEVARIFRLPPSKLQSFDHQSYSQLEEVNLDYYQSSQLPWITRFEKEWLRKLFPRKQRKTWSIEHDRTHLLKGRMLDQANVWQILLRNGVASPNQVAASYGWAPFEGGDVHLAQLNQAPVSALAKATLADLKGVKPAPADAQGGADADRSHNLIDEAIRAIAG